MDTLSSKEIFGNWATLLVPVDEHNSINFQRLEREIDDVKGLKVICKDILPDFF
ncbi:MAG: hypothetical protein H7069_12050 [Phormidesmis sp. FL-bin-119]|nr:hypothetical protein [Pedobacter sp.]